MKKTIITLALITMLGCEKKVDINDVDLYRGGDIKYYKNSDTPVTGRLEFKYFDDVAKIVTLKNGIKDGKQMDSYHLSSVKYIKSYKNGELDGKYITYYESKDFEKKGQIDIKGNFKNGKIHGVLKKYFKDGSIAYECKFIDGKKDGKEKYFYGKNMIYSVIVWDKGIEKTAKYYDMYGARIKKPRGSRSFFLNF